MKDVKFTLVVEFEIKYRKLLLDIYYLFIALFIARYLCQRNNARILFIRKCGRNSPQNVTAILTQRPREKYLTTKFSLYVPSPG